MKNHEIKYKYANKIKKNNSFSLCALVLLLHHAASVARARSLNEPVYLLRLLSFLIARAVRFVHALTSELSSLYFLRLRFLLLVFHVDNASLFGDLVIQ